MNTTKLVSVIGFAFLAFAVNAAETQPGGSPQLAYYQNSVDLQQDRGRFSGSYFSNNLDPHWTDSLRKGPSVPQQAMGLEYGRSYGDAGAIRPATDEALGPVAIYFRATF